MTESEAVGKILTFMHSNVPARLGINRDDAMGDSKWIIALEFGEEEAGSDMYAGAAYADGDNLAVVAEEILSVIGVKP